MTRCRLKSAARLLLAGLLLLCGLKVGAVYAQSSGSTLSPEAEQAILRGKAAAQQQKWDLAIKYFGEARKAAPNSPHVLFNLALAYDKSGGKEFLAIAWYRAYLTSAPNAPDAEEVRSRIEILKVKEKHRAVVPPDTTLAQPFSCETIVGRWDWNTGWSNVGKSKVTIKADGTMNMVGFLGGASGTWECTDPTRRNYTMKWRLIMGDVDNLTLSQDGTLLAGHNQWGAVSAKRIGPLP